MRQGIVHGLIGRLPQRRRGEADRPCQLAGDSPLATRAAFTRQGHDCVGVRLKCDTGAGAPDAARVPTRRRGKRPARRRKGASNTGNSAKEGRRKGGQRGGTPQWPANAARSRSPGREREKPCYSRREILNKKHSYPVSNTTPLRLVRRQRPLPSCPCPARARSGVRSPGRANCRQPTQSSRCFNQDASQCYTSRPDTKAKSSPSCGAPCLAISSFSNTEIALAVFAGVRRKLVLAKRLQAVPSTTPRAGPRQGRPARGTRTLDRRARRRRATTTNTTRKADKIATTPSLAA